MITVNICYILNSLEGDVVLFNNTSFRILEQGLDAVWLRQQVISQNIANNDTPGYKARTVNFSTVLEDTKANMKSGMKSQKKLNLKATVTTENGTNQTFNENNVDIEKEGVALADAQLQYETLINKITNEFNMIKQAVSK